MSKRINSIDALRILLAVAVVFYHINFNVAFEGYLHTLLTFPVPTFFIISGYFFASQSKEKKIKNIKRMVILCLVVYFLYLIFYRLFFEGWTIELNRAYFINLVMFNEPGLPFHGWYLFALPYCMIFAYFFNSVFLKYKKITIAIIVVLNIAMIILGNYLVVLTGKTIAYIYVRNFIFFGLPYFYIGQIFKSSDIKEIKVKNSLLIICLVICNLGSILEYYLLDSFKINQSSNVYLFQFLEAFVLFVIALKNADYNNKPLEILAKLGGKYSLGLYIVHIGVWHFLFHSEILKSFYFKHQEVQNFCVSIRPLMVLAFSFVLLFLYYKIKDVIILRFSKKAEK